MALIEKLKDLASRETAAKAALSAVVLLLFPSPGFGEQVQIPSSLRGEITGRIAKGLTDLSPLGWTPPPRDHSGRRRLEDIPFLLWTPSPVRFWPR